MKRVGLLLCISLIIISILLPSALARKGVGIVWDTETEIVTQGVEHCVQYGIYNPWDEDVSSLLGLSENLQDLIIDEDSEVRLIPANTKHDQAIPVQYCFEIGRVYEKDCLLGNFICEQKCTEEQVVYEGDVVVKEQSTGASGGSAGSATALGISVPLKLKVRCDAHGRNWSLVYIVIITVLLLLLGFFWQRKRKNQKSVSSTKKTSTKKKK